MSVSDFNLSECLARLATRNAGRTEADIQSDVRDVLLYGQFELGENEVRLETPAPDRRRIDVEVGALVIECKRDLRSKRTLQDATQQLEGYLRDRQVVAGSPYIGLLTDGITWAHYQATINGLRRISVLELSAGRIDERKFRTWLGSLLSTERLIAPTSASIRERLGSEAPACKATLAQLADLWQTASDHRDVLLKRGLWGKLLRTALGTQFEDDDSLFIEHTYLVLVATLIAHMVVGFNSSEVAESPATTLSGRLFSRAGLRGVGEAGFFDWVLDVPEGAPVVSDIARRLSVFTWSGVDHDVLKSLYHSVISEDTRHRLGEYYTPDWLAKRVVDTVVENPLQSRVLDPACGSGTFLFHSVRRFLDAADRNGQSIGEATSGVVEHVFGMDLHPVAVVLAQVTYLLAIGAERIREASVGLSIPVYLGDSMRWDTSDDVLMSPSGEIVVPTGDSGSLFSKELTFPASIVSDPGRFDRLVDELANLAADRERGQKPRDVTSLLRNFAVPEADRATLKATYRHLCELHDEGRDHIWGFFVRNQARPKWFTAKENHVDILVGNPPWLSYRFMPKEMQSQFRRRAGERNLWTGGRVATQQDLSALFVARSIQLYLRVGGAFGFVMPLAALSRKAYEGFRAGQFTSKATACTVDFDVPWDLDAVEPIPFPVPSSVVFGRRVALRDFANAHSMPREHLVVSGRVDEHGGTASADALKWTKSEVDPSLPTYSKPNSPYADRFRQGASLVPRMLILVEQQDPGPLQLKTQTSVRSRRGRLDKQPWRSLPDRTGTVESIFLRPVYLGEHCLPFATLPPVEAVIPHDGKGIVSEENDRIGRYPALAEWWRENETVWEANKSSASNLSLLGQVDYYGKLSAQFPIPAIRVVYTKSGNYLTAAIVTDEDAVIDHMLYWGSAATMDEARYLTAILNAPGLGQIVAPYQSRGAFGARHFDKYVWYPPIPEFDGASSEHMQLADLAKRAEAVVAKTHIPAAMGFQKARAVLREALESTGLMGEANDLVRGLLS